MGAQYYILFQRFNKRVFYCLDLFIICFRSTTNMSLLQHIAHARSRGRHLQLRLIDLLMALQQAKALMQALCAGRGDGFEQ